MTAVFTGFGERGRPAEEVAHEAVGAARLWLNANVPVDEYLADQLLLPMALAGVGSFRTTKPSLHATTNAAVIQRFLSVPIQFQQETDSVWNVVVGKQWVTSTAEQSASRDAKYAGRSGKPRARGGTEFDEPVLPAQRVEMSAGCPQGT